MPKELFVQELRGYSYMKKALRKCPYGICDGSGTLSTDVRNSDGNWDRGVGEEKCLCAVEEKEEDNQDRV